MRCLSTVCLCWLLLGMAASALADPAATGSLSITARDHSGKPLVGAWLAVQPSGQVTMTDADGAAKFTELLPGTYTVNIARTGYQSFTVPVTLAANPDNFLAFTMEKTGLRAVNPPPEYLLTPPVPPGSGPDWRAAQETVLREAVFRYLFAFSPDTKRYPVLYLSVQGFPLGDSAQGSKDPDAALLRRFRGETPPVKEVSALPASSKDWDNQARHYWIIFRVSSFQWTSDTQVEIDAGSAQSGFLSSDNIYLTCTLKNGWWEITGITEISA